MQLIRSLLYVPASSERFIAKAHDRGADAIILDLENAVVPTEKPSARARLPAAVASAGQRGAVVFVRINSQPDLVWLDAEAWAERNQISPLSPGLTSSSVTGSTTRCSTPGRGSPPEASRSGWALSRCASAVSKVVTPDVSVIP